MWCGAIRWDGMEWDGMSCGCDAMCLRDVVGCEVMWCGALWLSCGNLGDGVLETGASMPPQISWDVHSNAPWTWASQYYDSALHSTTTYYKANTTKYNALQSTWTYYKVLLRTTRYYTIPYYKGLDYYVLQSTATCYKVVRATTYYYGVHSATTSYKVLLRTTKYYRVLQSTARYYNVWCGTKFYYKCKVLLGRTKYYPVRKYYTIQSLFFLRRYSVELSVAQLKNTAWWLKIKNHSCRLHCNAS